MNREQLKKLERDLWAAADKLRGLSDLKPRRGEFVALVDAYFRDGPARLQASHDTLPALAERLRAVLGEDLADAGAEGAKAGAAGLAAVDHLLAQWVDLAPLANAQQAYFAAQASCVSP